MAILNIVPQFERRKQRKLNSKKTLSNEKERILIYFQNPKKLTYNLMPFSLMSKSPT
jgi:hypothetical protein